MGQDIWVVNAFTSVPFKGNPAGVMLLEHFPDAALMQQIAAQMNLSETAFLVRNAPRDYHLRWFTPAVEVNLCGHATLAATHILREEGYIAAGECVTYRTLSGDLHAKALEKAVELDFPTLPGHPVAPDPAFTALGVEIVACERNRDNDLVEVKDFATLLSCQPDFSQLAHMQMQGVIVTTANVVEGFDFASRYFGPGCGVNEDPVTGSAHCFLASYWARRLGKTSFHALQASRGHGILEVTLKEDRTLIAGDAITALRGQMQWQINDLQREDKLVVNY